MVFQWAMHDKCDTSDPQFTEEELRNAAAHSAGDAHLVIIRLYEARGLNIESWTKAPRHIRSAIAREARAAVQRWPVFVLVSEKDIITEIYVGREEAERATRLGESSQIVCLAAFGMGDPVVTYLELFPDNEPLVDELLRRWKDQTGHIPNTPKARAVAIEFARRHLERIRGTEQNHVAI